MNTETDEFAEEIGKELLQKINDLLPAKEKFFWSMRYPVPPAPDAIMHALASTRQQEREKLLGMLPKERIPTHPSPHAQRNHPEAYGFNQCLAEIKLLLT